MPYEALSLTFDGAVALIEVQRAGGGARVLRDLARACDEVRDRDDITVVVLTGIEHVPEQATGDAGDAAALARALELLPQPVIACVEGRAAGFALEMALACDVRIASEQATFAMPQVTFGGIPAAGGTQRLPRLVGRTRALEMILLGVELDAAAALDWGLVNALTNAGGTIDAAHTVAGRIAAQGPLAVRYAKEAVLRGLDMPLDQALRYETDLTVILQTTDDRAEGVRAFVEKRPPHFEGR